jgi:hypothetical protein
MMNPLKLFLLPSRDVDVGSILCKTSRNHLSNTRATASDKNWEKRQKIMSRTRKAMIRLSNLTNLAFDIE